MQKKIDYDVKMTDKSKFKVSELAIVDDPQAFIDRIFRRRWYKVSENEYVNVSQISTVEIKKFEDYKE